MTFNSCCGKATCCCGPEMTDCLAQEIECIWKACFCDASILPQIGFPSCGNCVMTLTHRLEKCPRPLKINELPSLSMLANNAFYTAEVSCGHWMNLYTVPIPNIPGKRGCKSSGEVYTEALVKLGISIGGDTYGWKGSCPSVIFINSSAINMHPCEFSKKQIAALKGMLDYFKCCRC